VSLTDQFHQMVIFHMLDLVSQYYELAINFVQFAALELKAELFATKIQRMSSRMFAQN